MPSLIDARFDALRAQGFTGSTSDMLLQWLQANGAVSNALTDAWSEFLDGQGFTYGQYNDSWYAYLGSLGYEGQINDRELPFWMNGGVVSPDGVRITQQPVRYSGLENSNATFTVVATSGNASTLFYQWQELISGTYQDIVDGGQISGATTATLTVSAIQVTDQGRRFRVRVTNSYNSINSQSADIRVSGATWFIIDEVTGDRMVTETLLDEIVDERSP